MRSFEPESEPYYLCYSGGKDSDCIKILADLAGVKHDTVFNVTTVDAPETMKYVRETPNVIWERPRYTMVQLIVKNRFPPSRVQRFCCKELKERSGKGRIKVTGTRWAESRSRSNNQGFVTALDGNKKKTQKMLDELNVDFKRAGRGVVLNNDNSESRKFVEFCYKTTSTLVNPIVDWTDQDVWDFLHYYGCESNPLYQCGFDRIGCVGCPLGGHKRQKRDFDRWPGFRKMYVYAFDKMLEEWDKIGKSRNDLIDGEHVMRWWIGEDINQVTLDDYYNNPEEQNT